ncbi:hypothetical protein BASA83_013001 [Batrachochytrium salamandrivorans]|nr:hypothetical protein BASA83_013001 [Batrachochytrium salamandrivorans]
MQFFHLFSFVAVTSYAAALPQPAGLSEQYSNNVDTTLASGLEARSYQPVLNSQGGDPASPLTLLDIKTNNLASTIDSIEDGFFNLYDDDEKVAEKISRLYGVSLTEYLGKGRYAAAALRFWAQLTVQGVFLTFDAGFGEDEYPKAEPDFREKLKELENKIDAGVDDVAGYVSNILEDVDSFVNNLEAIHELLKGVFSDSMHIMEILKDAMSDLELFKPLKHQLSEAYESVTKLSDQPRVTFDKVWVDWERHPEGCRLDIC